jgi:hypothetical protein
MLLQVEVQGVDWHPKVEVKHHGSGMEIGSSTRYWHLSNVIMLNMWHKSSLVNLGAHMILVVQRWNKIAKDL